jgi:Family of unknown function (DUF6345)
MRYSTGCVNNYDPCGSVSLQFCVKNGQDFRAWYGLAGHQLITRWDDGDVWGSDFRDGAGQDLDPNGGSDVPEIYFYSGHGTCQNAPDADDPDFILVCGNFGTPNSTDIGAQSRWGNSGGDLKFLFLDASCPMDLVSLGTNWFPVFDGLHVAVGHSGTVTSDTLDSPDRAGQFAALTAGALPWFFPQLSIGSAWMDAGITDIQSGCCAVVIAAGVTEADAIDRRENERISDNRPDPIPNWFAWRWLCM